MKAVIPIGGRGTRLRPITFSTNKHFLPVANKLLIHYPIEAVIESGITEIAITYNPGQLEFAQEILGDGSKWGAKFTYVLQEKPGGLANIFEVCEEYINGDRFVMHLGDNIFTDGIKNLVEYFEKEKPDGLVGILHHPENTRLGVPYFDENGRLYKYVEKPKDPPHDFAIPGVYFFDSVVFNCFRGKDKIQPSARGEYEISAPYQWMIDHGYRVDTMEIKGKWLDPGKFNDWLETNQYLLDKKTRTHLASKPDEESKIEGRVRIGKNTQIINSKIRGPVSIGDNVIIKDSYVGPYTSVYHNCQIEKTSIQNSVLMKGVKLVDITTPIENSIIGTEAEVRGKASTHFMSLFVAELSTIQV
jgi:glucose-1-phosphate thymidylyltransferase